jgi:SOS response regulatory protein OraA/RecX
VPARARGDALDLLERTGLIDDARVAATRAESLAERGFGDAAIRYDLEREGIAGDLIEEAVGGLEPEPERARALLKRRGADAKTGRWLATKGFDPSTVEDVLGGVADDF